MRRRTIQLPRPNCHSGTQEGMQLFAGFHMPEVDCECILCRRVDLHGKWQRKQPRIDYLKCKDQMDFFFECMKESKQKAGFRVQIVQTCFYSDGLPHKIYFNGDYGKPVSKEVLTEPKEIFLLLTENNNDSVQKSKKEDDMDIITRSLHMFLDVPAIHEKRLGTVAPSHLEVFPILGESRLIKVHNNNRILSEPHNQLTRKNSNCVVYFSDGCHSIINEDFLRDLLFHNSPNASYILMITRHIQPKCGTHQLFSSYVDSDLVCRQTKLFNLAQRETEEDLGILCSGDSNYISAEELQWLSAQVGGKPQKSVEYQTYKILWYLEKEVNIRTSKLQLGWITTGDGTYCLYFVYDFQYEQLFRKNITETAKVGDSKLQRDLLTSWEMCKTARSSQMRRAFRKPSEQSRELFDLLYPGGDFELLARQKQTQSLPRNRPRQLGRLSIQKSSMCKDRQRIVTPTNKRSFRSSTTAPRSRR